MRSSSTPRGIRVPYLRAAEAVGLSIAWVAETHLHADFVSGARELAREGARVLAAKEADLEYPHRGLDDGEEVDLGGLWLRAIATPGHTPEHLSFALLDGSEPVGVFTGGALLPGAVARTDLISPEQTEPLARALYRSIRERLLTLPDDTPVYPTHGSGSFCSVSTDGERTTTIGREREANRLLAAPDEDAFVREVLSSFGSYPRYFLRLREVNRRGPRVYGSQLPTLPDLAPDEVRRLVDAGAELIDVRPVDRFAAGHVPGTLSIELRPAFASWLGWLVPDDRPSGVRARSRPGPRRARPPVPEDRVRGPRGRARRRDDRVACGRARRNPRSPSRATRLRIDRSSTSGSGASSHPVTYPVPSTSSSAPCSSAVGGVPAGPLAIMCGHGQRAMTAASVLERAGRRDITVVSSGASDWATTTGRPLERS